MTRSRVRHVAGLAVAGLALTGAIGVSATTIAAPASAAENSIRVITHNVAKKPSALGGAIRKANATQGPEFVLLQEVCSSMVKRLQDDLGYTTFRPRRTAAKCGTNGSVGEATVWTGSGAAAAPR
ncbi:MULTISPECIES: hypothetical protein [unclassified Knoellia]|uniref:hypothetical protein n=1 Tax=Knoellia altitudinis TaxID=3404795 RepID=UPI00360EC36A